MLVQYDAHLWKFGFSWVVRNPSKSSSCAQSRRLAVTHHSQLASRKFGVGGSQIPLYCTQGFNALTNSLLTHSTTKSGPAHNPSPFWPETQGWLINGNNNRQIGMATTRQRTPIISRVGVGKYSFSY